MVKKILNRLLIINIWGSTSTVSLNGTHTSSVCTRVHQRLHLIRRLWLFGVSSNIMLFYKAMIESILRYGIIVWFGNLTVKLRAQINKLFGESGRKNYWDTDKIFWASLDPVGQQDFIGLFTCCTLSMRWWTLVGDTGIHYAGIIDTNTHLSHSLLN